MKIKIDSIEIVGMHNITSRTYSFNDFTYLTGHNGAGKTTVLQAIQLALLGYIPNTDKRKDAIFKHANGYEMSVTLRVNDDGVIKSIKRCWRRTIKGIEANVEYLPNDCDTEAYFNNILGNLELPIMHFNEFIGMTSNKLKDWFLNFLPKDQTDIDWNKTLCEPIQDIGPILDAELLPNTISSIQSFNTTGVDLVRDINKSLKEVLSFKKGELSRIQNTIGSLVYYADCPKAANVDTLKAEHSNATSRLDELKLISYKMQQNEETERKIQELNYSYTDLESNVEYQTAKLSLTNALNSQKEVQEALNQNRDERSTLVRSANTLEAMIRGNGTCQYTGETCEAIASKIDETKQSLERIQSQIEDLSKSEYELTAKYSTLEDSIAKFESDIRMRELNYSNYQMLNSRLDKTVQMDRTVLENETRLAQSLIDSSQDTIVKVLANERYQTLLDKLTSEKYTIDQTLEILKVWIKLTDVNGLQSSMMLEPFNRLSDKITANLRKFFNDNNLTARFILSEGANSFDFGIDRADGEYVSFYMLSDGERTLFAVSLLLAIIDDSSSPLKVLMIDDMLSHLDLNNVTQLFKSLYNVEGVQLLLAGYNPAPLDNADQFQITI